MMRRTKLSVTAMALAATLLTGSAFADPDPAPQASSPETPLSVRPTKPLTLEPTHFSTGGAWRFAVLAALLAGGVWIWKQRGKKAPRVQYAELHIVRRTTIGPRSELLLLEVDGQRLLIGVTPSSMQTLYLLPEPSSEESVADTPSESRISALLEARIAPPSPPQPEKREVPRAKAVAPSSDEDEAMFEGQAAGLRAIGSRR